MGYYTEYSLKVRNIDKDERTRLEAILEEMDLIGYVFWNVWYDEPMKEAEICSYEGQKWYDCEKDMIKISKYFPDAVFELSGEGENYGDLWREYFKNGEHEMCIGEIIYETPKKIQWENCVAF